MMSQYDERKEESEKGSSKGQRPISSHNNDVELPTSPYCFRAWQSIFLDILISSFSPPLTVFIHPYSNKQKQHSKQCKKSVTDFSAVPTVTFIACFCFLKIMAEGCRARRILVSSSQYLGSLYCNTNY